MIPHSTEARTCSSQRSYLHVCCTLQRPELCGFIHLSDLEKVVDLRVDYVHDCTYLILTEYEVNIGNKSQVKDRGEAEVLYEVFYFILTKYEVNIRFITTNSPYFKFQNDNLMNPGFMMAQSLHHHLLMQ